MGLLDFLFGRTTYQNPGQRQYISEDNNLDGRKEVITFDPETNQIVQTSRPPIIFENGSLS